MPIHHASSARLRHALAAALIATLAACAWVVVGAGGAEADGVAPGAVALTGSGPTTAIRSGQVAQVDQDSLLVIGDSLTSRYNNKRGAKMQGFWSLIAQRVGADPIARAQGGAGFVNPGLAGCKGYTFGEQLRRPGVREIAAVAGALIIEGGRNDTRVCAKGGGYDVVSSARVRRATNAFFADIRALRGPDDCTVVFTPWGPKGLDNRDRITKIVKKSAHKYGFSFVDTVGLLTEPLTIADRIHPNRKGSIALADRLVAKTFLSTCFS